MKFLKYSLLSFAMLFVVNCSKEQSEKTEAPANKPAHASVPNSNDGFSGSVLETMNAGGYTYAQIDMGESQIWVAGPQTEVKKGDVIQTTTKGSIMQNFNSQTLNRSFETIYFVDGFLKPGQQKSSGSADPHSGIPQNGAGAQGSEKLTFDDIKTPAGGSTIHNIFIKKAELAGKELTVRAKVVKANFNIMGTNWYHLQDGTGDKGTNDLTITSADKVSLNSTVLVKGKLTLDKDFGQGYKYDLIIEGASVITE